MAKNKRTTTPTLCCTYGWATSTSVSMKASALLSRLATGACPTTSCNGAVCALPTRNAGITSVPVRCGDSATANSAVLLIAPLRICICRLLLWLLNAKSARNGAKSGAPP
ncbi:hypothetical protein D3C81_1312150 [compost metagenome]